MEAGVSKHQDPAGNRIDARLSARERNNVLEISDHADGLRDRAGASCRPPALSFAEPSPDGAPPEVLTHGAPGDLVSCPVRRDPPMVVLRERQEVVSCLKRS